MSLTGQKQKQIIIVCKDEKDWIDTKTGAPMLDSKWVI